MLLLGSAIDGEALLEMLWTASLAGIGVTAIFGVAIVGAARGVEAGRERRGAEATFFTLLAVVALAAVAAAVIFGIVVMTQK